MANDQRIAKSESYYQTGNQVPELVEGQWSDLPGDLLDIIEGHLTLYVDKVHIRAICMSWYSHLPEMSNQQSRQLPWLLQSYENGIEEEEEEEEEEVSHALFDPFENKYYYLVLPEAKGKVFKGSSYGWVVAMEDIAYTSTAGMYLINPLTRATIQLPPRTTFPDVKEYHPDNVDEECTLFTEDGSRFFTIGVDHIKFLTRKVVLSSTPTSEDCVIVAIYGQYNRLAFCKCNDDKWTQVHVQAPYPTKFFDVIFYKEKLYALSQIGGLIVIEDMMDPNPKITEIVTVEPSHPIETPIYLVECDGELMKVRRFFDEESRNENAGFFISKLDEKNSRWVAVESLGEYMFFLGFNTSMSRWTCEYNKQNRICYTNDMSSGSFAVRMIKFGLSDIGVLDLEGEILDELPGFNSEPKFHWPLPIWLALSE